MFTALAKWYSSIWTEVIIKQYKAGLFLSMVLFVPDLHVCGRKQPFQISRWFDSHLISSGGPRNT